MKRHSLLVLLLVLNSCGTQAPEFIAHDFEGYTIALPTQNPATRSEEGVDGKISSASATAGAFKYLVVCWEIPMHQRHITEGQILDYMSMGAGAWKVATRRPVQIAGQQGLEITGESATGKHMQTRMLRTRDRVYLLTVGGAKSISAAAGAEQFFTSFRLRD